MDKISTDPTNTTKRQSKIFQLTRMQRVKDSLKTFNMSLSLVIRQKCENVEVDDQITRSGPLFPETT